MKQINLTNENLLARYFATMNKTTPPTRDGKPFGEILKDSLIVILTLIFVLLYAAAFTGKFDPLKDNTMLLRLEPLIFIFIGYYFARLPVRQTEKTLKDEITRQTTRADAAACAKEKAQLERETLEEKIKNARATLKSANGDTKSNKAALGILDT